MEPSHDLRPDSRTAIDLLDDSIVKPLSSSSLSAPRSLRRRLLPKSCAETWRAHFPRPPTVVGSSYSRAASRPVVQARTCCSTRTHYSTSTCCRVCWSARQEGCEPALSGTRRPRLRLLTSRAVPLKYSSRESHSNHLVDLLRTQISVRHISPSHDLRSTASAMENTPTDRGHAESRSRQNLVCQECTLRTAHDIVDRCHDAPAIFLYLMSPRARVLQASSASLAIGLQLMAEIPQIGELFEFEDTVPANVREEYIADRPIECVRAILCVAPISVSVEAARPARARPDGAYRT